MPKSHTVNSSHDGLDSFWAIAQHYNVSFQELKELNRGRGADISSGYTYEQRNPPFWLDNGDQVLLPNDQPEDKTLGEIVQVCKEWELPTCVYSQRTCGALVPLEGASVTLKARSTDGPTGEDKQKTTDADGNATFPDLKSGAYVVQIEADGHEPHNASFQSLLKGSPCHQVFLERPTNWDLAMIPGIMRANGWTTGADLMDHWFSRSAYTYPDPENVDEADIPFNDTIVKLQWVRGFPRAQSVYEDMWEDEIYANPAARRYIERTLVENNIPTTGIASFGDLNQRVNLVNASDFYVQNRAVTNSIMQDLDGLVAALANFSFRMAVEGRVTYKERRKGFFGREYDVYEVRIKRVGLYVRDSYDFIGDQFGGLGHWNPTANTVTTFGSSGAHEVRNEHFRDWRQVNGCGGDFIVFSDLEIREVDSSWEMEIDR